MPHWYLQHMFSWRNKQLIWSYEYLDTATSYYIYLKTIQVHFTTWYCVYWEWKWIFTVEAIIKLNLAPFWKGVYSGSSSFFYRVPGLVWKQTGSHKRYEKWWLNMYQVPLKSTDGIQCLAARRSTKLGSSSINSFCLRRNLFIIYRPVSNIKVHCSN